MFSLPFIKKHRYPPSQADDYVGKNRIPDGCPISFYEELALGMKRLILGQYFMAPPVSPEMKYFVKKE